MLSLLQMKALILTALLMGGVIAEEKECPCEISLARAAACGGAAVVAAPYALAAAGFTAAGVAAGSIAAFFQSMIGNVAAGSVFAGLQSAGAAGLGSGSIAGVAATAAGVCGFTKSKECCKK